MRASTTPLHARHRFTSQAFVALEKKSGSSPGAKLTLGWKPTVELRGGTRPAPRSLRNPAPPGSAGRTGCSLQRLRRCGCSWPRLRSTCAGRHPRPVPRVTRHYGSISGLSRQQRRISVSQRPRALAESPKPKILGPLTDADARGFVPRLGAVGAAGALVGADDGRRVLHPPSSTIIKIEFIFCNVITDVIVI